MQLIMWQPDTVRLAHFVWNSLVPCLMLLMIRHDHLHQPWRLDECKAFIPGPL